MSHNHLSGLYLSIHISLSLPRRMLIVRGQDPTRSGNPVPFSVIPGRTPLLPFSQSPFRRCRGIQFCHCACPPLCVVEGNEITAAISMFSILRASVASREAARFTTYRLRPTLLFLMSNACPVKYYLIRVEPTVLRNRRDLTPTPCQALRVGLMS